MSLSVRSFPELRNRLTATGRRVRVVVCRPADAHTLQAVLESVRLGFVHALLVGEYDAATLAAPRCAPKWSACRPPMPPTPCNAPCSWCTTAKAMCS